MNNNLEFENEDPSPDSIEDNHPRTNYGEGYGGKERMYSEDDIKSAFYTDNRKWSNRFQDYIEVDFEEWFEQFKKK